jgi:integrase
MQVGDKSYASYVGKNKVFSEWLSSAGLDQICISQITNQNIADFFVYLATEKGLDRTTCQKYYLNIRKVFSYAHQRGEIESIPFSLVVFPQKKEDKSAGVIPQDHMRVLMETIKKKDKQLYLACMTEFYCFIRPGTELRLLKVSDIDLNNGTIQVGSDHAKNGHKRIVTVPNQLIELFKEYGIDKAEKGMYVFGRSKRPDTAPCSVNMLRYRFNKYRNKLKMARQYKLYSMKHSGATLLHNSNQVSLRDMMDQLGHSRMEATQRYIKKHAGIINPRIKENFPNPY